MSGQMKKGFVMALVVGVLLLLYQHFPDYQGVIVLSAFFGLAVTPR